MRFRQSGRRAHPSLSPSRVPSRTGLRRSLPGAAAALAWCALILAAAVGGTALADPPTDQKPKASSFAPRHSNTHVYGTPVSKPILHKRKKRTPPATAPAQPIK